MVDIECIADRGWAHCTAMQHDGLRLVVTNDVGPRIIECSLGGPNLFAEFADQLGRTASDEYLLFGGHRLWIAPERFPLSYAPDLDPVQLEPIPDGMRFVQPEEPTNRIVKSIAVEILGGHRFRLVHGIRNHNPWPIELAPWAMTLMAPGTRAIVPQEPFRPHPEFLDPARTLTLWGYTRMDDPRVCWGRRFIQLREDPSVEGKFKVGIQNRQRWVACWVHGCLVVRTFGFDPDARYPDGGCNCETFTMPGFLEMETLGPLRRLQPGEQAEHEEIWHLWRVDALPEADDALAAALAPFLAQLQFPGPAA